MAQTELLKRTAEKLFGSTATGSVLIGFDGFVDNILKPVRTRENVKEYTPIDNIVEFSKRIASASGKSTNIEIVKLRSSFGGNGPIMANSLIELGHEMTFIGSLGKSEILPIFKPFAHKCKNVKSFSDPGITDAFEMNDGKVMFNYPQSVLEMDWNMITGHVGTDNLKNFISKAGYLAFTNWTMIPSMNGIFEGLTEMLSGMRKRKTVYIDLSDPKKRSREDLRQCMELLVKMNKYADVILGLNESEASQTAAVTGANTEYADIKELAENINSKMKIKAVVIHSIKQASAASEEGSYIVNGPYTPEPKLSTGAGDIFNAGFYAGYIAGLNPDECLITGTANSGFYVRNERTPKTEELIKFILLWKENNYN